MWLGNGTKVCSLYVLNGNFVRIRLPEAANAARVRRRRPLAHTPAGQYPPCKSKVFTSGFPTGCSMNTWISSLSGSEIHAMATPRTTEVLRSLEKSGQRACKPGSVPAGHRRGMAIHLGCPSPDTSRDLPGQRGPGMKPAGKPVCRPYSVLLPVGFALPPPLPAARCALTAPFHPCPQAEACGRFAFCGTFPEVALAGGYPAPYPHGARTFLPRGARPRGGGHPAF